MCCPRIGQKDLQLTAVAMRRELGKALAVPLYWGAVETMPCVPDSEGRIGAAHELQPGPHEAADEDTEGVAVPDGGKPRYPTGG